VYRTALHVQRHVLCPVDEVLAPEPVPARPPSGMGTGGYDMRVMMLGHKSLTCE